MNARVTYKVAELFHPFDEKRRLEGIKAWCLVKVTTPEFGRATEEAVAMFNFDSEAISFMGHVFATGLDAKLVTIDRDVRACFAQGIRL